MTTALCWIVALALLYCACGTAALVDLNSVKKKFEYKHSFKGPHLVNGAGEIPFWSFGGDAIPSWDQVRVCPSIHSRQGWLWNKVKFSHKDWMVDVQLKVMGRLRTGADGMAFWFTAEKGEPGPAFGGPAQWHGLGVFLDSFDNDGKQDNPKILVVFNDGTMTYGHSVDGSNQDQFSCLKDYRNRPHTVRLRIIRMNGALEVWVHEGLTQRDADYDLCGMVSVSSDIPDEGYFGITAATGGLSDDHDVLSFVVHSLSSQEGSKTPDEVYSKEQTQQFQDKFDQYSEELDKKRAAQPKDFDHPNFYQDSFEKEYDYEVGWEKNVRQILEAQATMNRILQLIQGKTEIIMDKVSAQQQGGVATQHGHQQHFPPTMTSELTAIKNTQSLVQHQLSDLREYLEQNKPHTGGGGAVASEALQPIYELRHLMQQATEKNDQIISRLATIPQPVPCPPAPPCQSCVTVYHLVVLAALQLVALFGYNWFRQRQESAAKKFF